HNHLAAVSIDSRNLDFGLSTQKNLTQIKEQGIDHELLYIDTSTDELLRRYSETRRRHPLTSERTTLREGIGREIELLAPMKKSADRVIDTTGRTPHELREQIRLIAGEQSKGALLLFESFGFKHGVPREADFVFDVRCLPNPYWEESIRHLSGLDEDVKIFLETKTDVSEMVTDIAEFVEKWLPRFQADNRSYLTIAIGCTGGRHRSVFTANQLVDHFTEKGINAQIQHRDLLQ
ncbi:MAG: UPF0042 nucleotide-binding protein, partial [Neolewinella sp.]